MATGPGKYDDACTAAREATAAQAVALIVIEGEKGSGFSVQSTDPRTLAALPYLMRNMASQIEADLVRQGIEPFDTHLYCSRCKQRAPSVGGCALDDCEVRA